MSTTTEQTTPDYGVVEDFPVTNPAPYSVIEGNGGRVAHCAFLWSAERVAACLNACVGMADPAAEIAAMREALRKCASEEYGARTMRDIARAALGE